MKRYLTSQQTDPTKQAVELVFSQNKKKHIWPPTYFNNVENHKHLGPVLEIIST